MARLIGRATRWLAIALLISATPGCADAQRHARVVLTYAQREALRAEALTEFDTATFLKPDESGCEIEASLFDLAPLILEQVDDKDDNAGAHYFGGVTELTTMLGPQAWGLPFPQGGPAARSEGRRQAWPETGRPAVYWKRSFVLLGGSEYDQVVYVWWHRRRPDNRELGPHQGIRITLGTDGFPVAWEVLGLGDGVKRLFVSSTLEGAARDKFGGPLPGRSFAIERSVDNAPDAVVVRIIEDGPIPMGPYVYLAADAHEVTTLLCRCSPSQVSRIVETDYYSLLPLEYLEESDLDLPDMPDSLARCLRWPYDP